MKSMYYRGHMLGHVTEIRRTLRPCHEDLVVILDEFCPWKPEEIDFRTIIKFLYNEKKTTVLKMIIETVDYEDNTYNKRVYEMEKVGYKLVKETKRDW